MFVRPEGIWIARVQFWFAGQSSSEERHTVPWHTGGQVRQEDVEVSKHTVAASARDSWSGFHAG